MCIRDSTPHLLAPIDTATSNTSPMLTLTTTYQIQQRTPQSLAPIDAATSTTLPMPTLTTAYQMQQRTPRNCMHESTLLHRRLRQCFCLPPHIKCNNEHSTIACTNQCFSIEHFANAYADHHISNTMMNTSQLLALIDAATIEHFANA